MPCMNGAETINNKLIDSLIDRKQIGNYSDVIFQGKTLLSSSFSSVRISSLFVLGDGKLKIFGFWAVGSTKQAI